MKNFAFIRKEVKLKEQLSESYEIIKWCALYLCNKLCLWKVIFIIHSQKIISSLLPKNRFSASNCFFAPDIKQSIKCRCIPKDEKKRLKKKRFANLILFAFLIFIYKHFNILEEENMDFCSKKYTMDYYHTKVKIW